MSIQISLSDEAAESLWWLIKNQLEGRRGPLWTIEESAEMDKIMDRITKPVDNRVQAKRTRTPWPGETDAVFVPPIVSELEAKIFTYECRVERLMATQGDLKARIATLETAARAVCEARWSDERIKAIEELGRVLGEVE